jgi:hypothetical protein
MRKETKAGRRIRLDGEAEMAMDSMMAQVENARRYEDVAAGMQVARLLTGAVRVHVLTWLSGLPEGIGEWLAGLRLAGARVEGVRRLDA